MLNERNWLYVTDNCRGIMKVLKHAKVGSVYNIAGNFQLSNKELIEIIIKTIEEFKNIKYITDRLGHDYRCRISGEKIKEELGFSPIINIKNGIKLLIGN